MTGKYNLTNSSLEYVSPPGNKDRDNIKSRQKICVLKNFPSYFLQYVFILDEDVGFRLAVIHQDEVKTNEFFRTLKAAKKAFAYKYNKKALKKNVVPKWTDLYEPDSDWLIEKQMMLKNDIKSRQIKKARRKTAPGRRVFRHRPGIKIAGRC